MGPISFGDTLIVPPAGLKEYITEVDLRPENDLKVRVEARLDMDTGIATWKFASLDPETNSWPTDPLAGFLPPNVTPPEGDGSVFYTVKVKENTATGTQVLNQAQIVFDFNEPILTPVWFNTIDSSKPQSAVMPLDDIQRTGLFLIEWSGSDEGSGMKNYTVYVSEDGSDYTPWISNTTDTSAYFTGEAGKQYSFYSIARDQAGNQELPPEYSDATTRVVLNSPPRAVDDQYTLDEDHALNATDGVLTNDGDDENNPLTAALVETVSHGELDFNSDGTFVYVPAGNFNGADSFTYKVSDGEFESDVATVQLMINAINDAPVADAGHDQMLPAVSAQGTTVVLDGLGSEDIEGDELSFRWTGPFPEGNGVVSGVNPSVTLPIGKSTVTLIVNDGDLDSAPDTADIMVTVEARGFEKPMAQFVLEGEEVVFPDKALKQGRTLPLKLSLLAGESVLTDQDVTPPEIVLIDREGSALDIETMDLDSGNANDNGYLFRFTDSKWMYNLSTKSLSAGTYTIAILMPDGVRYVGGFVLR